MISPTPSPTPSPSPPLILIVEDNLDNQFLIEFLLTSSGCLVLLATSAPEALLALASHHPDLILMDVQLPGQDGLALTRQLKADPITAPIPIVALTARAMLGDRERCLQAGCSGYITKPINTSTIVAELSAFLPHSLWPPGLLRPSS